MSKPNNNRNNCKLAVNPAYGIRYGTGRLSTFKNTRPIINIDRETYDQFRYLVQVAKQEVEWRAHLSEDTWKDSDGNTHYTITGDIQIPEQVVSNSSADVSIEEEVRLVEEAFDKGKNPNLMRVWAHSHVSMSTNPSSTDDENLEDIVSNLKDGIVVRIIMNKQGSLHMDVVEVSRSLVWESQDIIVNWSTSEETLKLIEATHKERVKSYVPQERIKPTSYVTLPPRITKIADTAKTDNDIHLVKLLEASDVVSIITSEYSQKAHSVILSVDSLDPDIVGISVSSGFGVVPIDEIESNYGNYIDYDVDALLYSLTCIFEAKGYDVCEVKEELQVDNYDMEYDEMKINLSKTGGDLWEN